jgi:hypothetical protein
VAGSESGVSASKLIGNKNGRFSLEGLFLIFRARLCGGWVFRDVWNRCGFELESTMVAPIRLYLYQSDMDNRICLQLRITYRFRLFFWPFSSSFGTKEVQRP